MRNVSPYFGLVEQNKVQAALAWMTLVHTSPLVVATVLVHVLYGSDIAT